MKSDWPDKTHHDRQGLILSTHLPVQQKLVLTVLHYHEQVEGACRPTEDLLAGECSISFRLVRRHLGDLRRLGLLSWEPVCDGGVNNYVIHWETIEKMVGGTK